MTMQMLRSPNTYEDLNMGSNVGTTNSHHYLAIAKYLLGSISIGPISISGHKLTNVLCNHDGHLGFNQTHISSTSTVPAG